MSNDLISVLRADLLMAMDDLRQSGRDYSADLLKKALFSPPVSAEPVGLLLEVRTLGSYGKAFDLPGHRRAYTYDHQPGNVEASRLGNACQQAAAASAGDTIDRGLGLLKELQAQGFGVFDAESSRWHAAPVAAQAHQVDRSPEMQGKPVDNHLDLQGHASVIFAKAVAWADARVESALIQEQGKPHGQSCDEAAQTHYELVQALRNLQAAQQPVSGADGLPEQTKWPVLKAMASNYVSGKHVWDHLNADACAKGAEEIRLLRAALAQQASRPEAVPGNSEILDLAISEGMTAKGGVYCGSAATILCFAGTLIRGAALAQQDADKVDTALAEMVHAMFRSGNSVPVTRITIDRKQYDAIACAARKEPDQ